MDIIEASYGWHAGRAICARMARLAIAEYYRRDIAEIEEIWPLLSPPYAELFDWLEAVQTAPRPEAGQFSGR